MTLLVPDQMVQSIYDISLQQLKDAGIKAIITDLDNTIVPCHSSEIAQTLLCWVDEVRGMGINMAIVSNNTFTRVQRLSDQLGVIFVSKALKPKRGAFRHIASHFQVSPAEVAVVGDQLLTDVLGGNRMGMYTILVTPISKKEFVGTKIIRLLEKFILLKMMKKGKLTR